MRGKDLNKSICFEKLNQTKPFDIEFDYSPI